MMAGLVAAATTLGASSGPARPAPRSAPGRRLGTRYRPGQRAAHRSDGVEGVRAEGPVTQRRASTGRSSGGRQIAGSNMPTSRSSSRRRTPPTTACGRKIHHRHHRANGGRRYHGEPGPGGKQLAGKRPARGPARPGASSHPADPTSATKTTNRAPRSRAGPRRAARRADQMILVPGEDFQSILAAGHSEVPPAKLFQEFAGIAPSLSKCAENALDAHSGSS